MLLKCESQKPTTVFHINLGRHKYYSTTIVLGDSRKVGEINRNNNEVEFQNASHPSN